MKTVPQPDTKSIEQRIKDAQASGICTCGCTLGK
jgi:hypothetical protein